MGVGGCGSASRGQGEPARGGQGAERVWRLRGVRLCRPGSEGCLRSPRCFPASRSFSAGPRGRRGQELFVGAPLASGRQQHPLSLGTTTDCPRHGRCPGPTPGGERASWGAGVPSESHRAAQLHRLRPRAPRDLPAPAGSGEDEGGRRASAPRALVTAHGFCSAALSARGPRGLLPEHPAFPGEGPLGVFDLVGTLQSKNRRGHALQLTVIKREGDF